jgi:hypothetical protein
MERVNIQSFPIAQVVTAFMPAASPLNVIATFRNVGINLVIADEKLICRITPRSALCLMTSVDFEGNPRDATVSDAEATETQPYLERIVTDTEELEEERKTNLHQVYNCILFDAGVRGFVLCRGVFNLTLYFVV